METIAVCVTAIVALVMICSTALAVTRAVTGSYLLRSVLQYGPQKAVEEGCRHILKETIGNGKGN